MSAYISLDRSTRFSGIIPDHSKPLPNLCIYDRSTSSIDQVFFHGFPSSQRGEQCVILHYSLYFVIHNFELPYFLWLDFWLQYCLLLGSFFCKTLMFLNRITGHIHQNNHHRSTTTCSYPQNVSILTVIRFFELTYDLQMYVHLVYRYVSNVEIVHACARTELQEYKDSILWHLLMMNLVYWLDIVLS